MAKAFSPKVRKRAREREPHEEYLGIARKFSKEVQKQLGDFVKSIVLFGSCATDTTGKSSDIDILLIVDDVIHVVSPPVVQEYRQIVSGAATRTSTRLHINTLKLSNFWEYCKQGDPVVTNMLRDGHPLVDNGIFSAAQLLLDQGRIRPTSEAIWTYYSRTTTTLRSASKHILSACVDLYWAAIDAAHAALMAVGEVPATPEHVPDLLEKVLVKQGMLARHYPRIMRELYHLQKGIMHREIKEITGEQFEGYWIETLKLVDALRTVVESHPPH